MTNPVVLVSGGAGFIGTHLVQALAPHAGKIVVLDSLLPQVHGPSPVFSTQLQSKAVCIQGDVTDPDAVARVAQDHPDIQAIVHLAAFTGTGQSMYELRDYNQANAGGTATLLQSIVEKKWPTLEHVVHASSRAIYGEGAYADPDDPARLVYPPPRMGAALADGDWSPHMPGDGRTLTVRPTPEDAPAQPNSFYGATKLVQEEYLKVILAALGIPLTMLRFQNVYGPGQSLKNPYTGVIGVFFSRLVQGKGLEVYEDGEVSRDFVYVEDVVQALAAALHRKVAGTYNVGSGVFTTLYELVAVLQATLGTDLPVTCRGTYRVGDIRHAAADLTRVHAALDYAPQCSFAEGISRYVQWAQGQEAMSESAMQAAASMLAAAGLSNVSAENSEKEASK